MSLSTSKSKTQLAYARSGKAVNKPKSKNNNTNQSNELVKGKHPARNSTGNIYQSIMGQIQPKQQDYIKGLIVKNQRESIRHDKQGEKQANKNLNQSKKNIHNTTGSKALKQSQVSKKTATVLSHDRTKSQASLLKDSTKHIQTSTFIKTESQKQITQISCNHTEREIQHIQSQLKIASNPSKQIIKMNQPNVLNSGFSLQKNDKGNNPKNPIIEALNSVSSFAKKLDVSQIQYPTQQRQQRSTHKKVGSKLVGEYFSCQTSPKNGSKNNMYTKQVVITTKPQSNYNSVPKNQSVSVSISPISSIKNSNKKQDIKKIDQTESNPTNFISCLDEYLQALTLNTSEPQQNNRASTCNVNMKRNNSLKFKEFSTSKGHPFTLGKQDQEEQTIVLQNGPYNKYQNTKFDQGKLLSYNQQQKLIKQLQKQKRMSFEKSAYIQQITLQLGKYKRKIIKMKQIQQKMIDMIKELDEKLAIQKNQRKKVQRKMVQFGSQMCGYSRGKDKKRRDLVEDQQRPERKTIYGASSIVNSIHYNQPRSKVQKHSKKLSANNSRFSSMINNGGQQYPNNYANDEQNYENYYPEKKRFMEEGFSKNKTQKFSKIISSFELQNQPCDDDQQMYFKANRNQKKRDSMKNIYPPNSCKNSYLNSSLPANRGTKSNQLTHKAIDELFRSNKSNKNSQQYHHIESNDIDSELDEDLSVEYLREQYCEQSLNRNQSQQSESEFQATQMSEDEYLPDDQNTQEYYQQRIKRMR